MARRASDPFGSLSWIRYEGHDTTILGGDGPPAPCSVDPPLVEALAGPPPAEVTLTAAGRPPVRLSVVAVPSCPGLAVGVDAGAAHGGTVEHLVNQIAHDLRNHAFGIGLRAELGQRRAEPGGDLHAQFATVLRQVDALKAYLDRLLLFGRTPALRPTELDAVAFLSDTVERFRGGFDPAGATPAVSIVTATPSVRVRWDAGVVSAAVTELLDNAARSAQPPPPIELSLTESGGTVRIGVVDRGPGVPSAALANLDRPMAVRRAGRAGLGLAIARKLAEAHGGRLCIETGPEGTTAAVVLPREAEAG